MADMNGLFQWLPRCMRSRRKIFFLLDSYSQVKIFFYKNICPSKWGFSIFCTKQTDASHFPLYDEFYWYFI